MTRKIAEDVVFSAIGRLQPMRGGKVVPGSASGHDLDAIQEAYAIGVLAAEKRHFAQLTRPGSANRPAWMDIRLDDPEDLAAHKISFQPVVLRSLLDAGFRCLGDLRWVSGRELRQFRYIGIKNAQQLRDVLRRMEQRGGLIRDSGKNRWPTSRLTRARQFIMNYSWFLGACPRSRLDSESVAEQCPNCKIRFDAADNIATLIVGPDDRQVDVEAYICPECEQYIVYATVPERKRVHPPVRDSVNLSEFIPPSLLRDFEEAKRVLDASPNASAMLSRRSLQRLIREHLGITEKTLDLEIRSTLRSNQLPSYLAEDLDAVRHIGNFGAHPKKSQNTGEVVDVEPGEAVWTIEVLEGLFDFYFVAPQKAIERRELLNQKLADAGQQPIRNASVIAFPKKSPDK